MSCSSILLCYLRPRPDTELLRVASQGEARPLLRGNSHLPEQLYQLCWSCENSLLPFFLSGLSLICPTEFTTTGRSHSEGVVAASVEGVSGAKREARYELETSK